MNKNLELWLTHPWSFIDRIIKTLLFDIISIIKFNTLTNCKKIHIFNQSVWVERTLKYTTNMWSLASCLISVVKSLYQ
jgi:hypothetical protein